MNTKETLTSLYNTNNQHTLEGVVTFQSPSYTRISVTDPGGSGINFANKELQQYTIGDKLSISVTHNPPGKLSYATNGMPLAVC